MFTIMSSMNKTHLSMLLNAVHVKSRNFLMHNSKSAIPARHWLTPMICRFQ